MACDWHGLVGRDVLGGHSHTNTLLCVDMHKHLTCVMLHEGLNQEFNKLKEIPVSVSFRSALFCVWCFALYNDINTH